MSSEDLLSLVRSLERELHKPSVRRDATRLNKLLHPEFTEFGRSGCSYTKVEVLKYLLEGSANMQIQSQDFVLRVLSQNVVLLTYRSAQVNEAAVLKHHTLRSSIWQLEPIGWQMVFHQGTPTDAGSKSAT